MRPGDRVATPEGDGLLAVLMKEPARPVPFPFRRPPPTYRVKVELDSGEVRWFRPADVRVLTEEVT